jgi:hypothetical protein
MRIQTNGSSRRRGNASRLGRWAGILVGLVGMSAHAGYASLSLPHYKQTQNDWCAIASAKMLLAYYGSSVEECEIANYDFGQTTCCNDPSSAACNPGGSFTGTPIAHYGLSYYQYPNNSFSFAQFQSEIDAGRPVSIGWSWTCDSPPCGGHAMNVGGYYSSDWGSYLEVWDPFQGAGCPAGEDICWMTYAQYFGGSGYNHIAQATLYNIKFSPVCSSDYFDLPGSQMQQCFDTWTHRGRSAAALTSTMRGGDVAYSGSYQPANGSGWY